MTNGQKIAAGAKIVKAWELRQDTERICQLLGIRPKEYYECLDLFLQKPITVQADMIQRLGHP